MFEQAVHEKFADDSCYIRIKHYLGQPENFFIIATVILFLGDIIYVEEECAMSINEEISKAIKDFTLAKYNLRIKSGKEGLELPPYKGSTFRGVFGHAFKSTICSHAQDCHECEVKSICAYSYIFETTPPDDTMVLKTYDDIPRPFVIEPPLNFRTHYDEGDKLSFNLILLGRAITYLPYFIYAFQRAGEMGIGKGRRPYSLDEVKTIELFSDKGETIYTIYDGKVINNDRYIRGSEIVEISKRYKNVERLTLSFDTMLRIKKDKHLVTKMEFHILIRSILRRFSNLCYFHHDYQPELDYKRIIEASQQIKIVEDDTDWNDWERFSNRQDSRMRFGGLVGKITYEGPIGDFMPLLLLGEQIHAGKNVTFGLGKYSILV
jgi:hypothetical protein